MTPTLVVTKSTSGTSDFSFGSRPGPYPSLSYSCLYKETHSSNTLKNNLGSFQRKNTDTWAQPQQTQSHMIDTQAWGLCKGPGGSDVWPGLRSTLWLKATSHSPRGSTGGPRPPRSSRRLLRPLFGLQPSGARPGTESTWMPARPTEAGGSGRGRWQK